jgi:hypothetical protein
LQLTIGNCQRPGIQNPQSTFSSSFPYRDSRAALSAQASRSCFPFSRQSRASLGPPPSPCTRTRTRSPRGHRGQWVPWHRTIIRDRSPTHRKHRNTEHDRPSSGATLCAGPSMDHRPPTSIQHPKATACRTQPAGTSSPPTHQPTKTSCAPTAVESSLSPPFPSHTLPQASQRCARGLHRGPNAVKVVVVLYCTVGQGWCVPAGSTDSESCTFKKGDGGSTSQLVSRLHVSDHFWEARCLFKLPR